MRLIPPEYKRSERTYYREDECYFKQLRQFRPQCIINEKGVQIMLLLYHLEERTSYEMRLCQCPADGVWVDLHTYGFSDPSMIPQQEAKLLRAWVACNEAGGTA